MDITIAHISDPHAGKINFMPEKLETAISEINSLDPDVVVLSGDLTMFGFENEYTQIRDYVDRFNNKVLAVPGNHDSRYMGHIYFEKFFGKRNWVENISDELTIVGIDTSIPDLDEGTAGRGKQKWLVRELRKIPQSTCKVVTLHHHLVPVPMTGRERAVLTDAGDILDILTREGVDLALSGHRHTPSAWILNNLALVTAGSASSEKVRATIKQSYNIIRVTDEFLEITLKEIGGKEKLVAKYNRIKGRKYVITNPQPLLKN